MYPPTGDHTNIFEEPHMTFHSRVTGICMSVCFMSGVTIAQPVYDIVPLDELIFYEVTGARSINELSQIVGHRVSFQGEVEAVLWRDDLVFELGKLPRHDMEMYSAICINESGIILIDVEHPDHWGHDSLIWDPTLELIDTNIPFPSFSYELNNAGRFSLTNDEWGISPRYAYIWADGQLLQLDQGQYEKVYAGGLNNKDDVVGSADGHAVIWPNNTNVVDIHPDFATSSRASDINDGGQVVGFYQIPGPDERLRLFLYENSNYEEIAILEYDSIFASSEAIKINNVGEIVVTDFGSFQGYLIKDSVQYNLLDIIDDPNEDWDDIKRVSGINDAGWIVGTGKHHGSFGTAFLMIPRYEFRTTGLVPGLAGETNMIHAYNATPDGRVVFAYGYSRGTFTLHRVCPGVTIDINKPSLVGTTFADADGNATLERFVSPTLENVTIYFQAIDIESCQTSPVLVHHFPQPGF